MQSRFRKLFRNSIQHVRPYKQCLSEFYCDFCSFKGLSKKVKSLRPTICYSLNYNGHLDSSYLTLIFHDLVAIPVPIPLFPNWKLSILHWSEASTSTVKNLSNIYYYTVDPFYLWFRLFVANFFNFFKHPIPSFFTIIGLDIRDFLFRGTFKWGTYPTRITRETCTYI